MFSVSKMPKNSKAVLSKERHPFTSFMPIRAGTKHTKSFSTSLHHSQSYSNIESMSSSLKQRSNATRNGVDSILRKYESLNSEAFKTVDM